MRMAMRQGDVLPGGKKRSYGKTHLHLYRRFRLWLSRHPHVKLGQMLGLVLAAAMLLAFSMVDSRVVAEVDRGGELVRGGGGVESAEVVPVDTSRDRDAAQESAPGDAREDLVKETPAEKLGEVALPPSEDVKRDVDESEMARKNRRTDPNADRQGSEDAGGGGDRDGGGGSSSDKSSPPAASETTAREKIHLQSDDGSTSFYQWFQGAHPGAVRSTDECPDGPRKRLCEMVVKFLRRYKVRQFLDVSCRLNTEWMPAVVQNMEKEVWGFRYLCSSHEGPLEDSVRAKLASLSSVEFLEVQWWHQSFPAGVDLILAWDIFPHCSYGRVFHFFVGAKGSEAALVLFDSYQGLVNQPSPQQHSRMLNVRSYPFRFPRAKEVVQAVTDEGADVNRQLLLYDPASLELRVAG